MDFLIEGNHALWLMPLFVFSVIGLMAYFAPKKEDDQ